jgi:putative membrane protein
MWLDFVLASIHHVLVFSLFAIITMELMLAKPGIDASGIGRLARVDGLYGLFSMLILIVGFSRAIWGLKGWDYYAGNHLFWTKVGAFLLVGLLSIKPTIAYLKWNKAAKANPVDLPSDEEVRANRKWLRMETTVLIFIPIIAAALARGIAD